MFASKNLSHNSTNSNTQPNTIAKLWAEKASEGIDCLISFRSAAHRWLAAGQVDDGEFVIEMQRLDDCGLSSWFDELLGLVLADEFRRVQEQRLMPSRTVRRRWLSSAIGLLVLNSTMVTAAIVEKMKGAR